MEDLSGRARLVPAMARHDGMPVRMDVTFMVSMLSATARMSARPNAEIGECEGRND